MYFIIIIFLFIDEIIIKKIILKNYNSESEQGKLKLNTINK